MSENNNGKTPAILTVGTPQCALACAFLGAVVAVLLLTIGFWKTLFIALFIFAGLFVGGVRDKGECIRSATEAVLPRKEVKVYQAQEKKPVPQVEEPDEETDEDEEEGEEEEDPDDAEEEEEASEEEEAEEVVAEEVEAEDGKEDGDEDRKTGKED